MTRRLGFFYIFLLYMTYTILGRPLWHTPKKLISFKTDGVRGDSSKQVFDIYTISHITHGILFFYFFRYLKTNINTALYGTIILETIWEIFENSPFIINKYRSKKEYKFYQGDSIVNIIGDILATILGFYFAYKSPYSAFIFIIITEILLLPFHASLLQLSIGSLLIQGKK